MPTPRLPLPTDARVTAFRAFVDALKASPELRAMRCIILSWDGSTESDDPPPQEATWIRCTPSLQSMTPVAVLGNGLRSYQADVVVTIETHVPGWNVDNSINLFGLIETLTCVPGAPIANQLAQAASGIADVLLEQPAAVAGPDLVAEGSIRLVVYLTR